jgi:diadenosine tetraphosphate (Ap4A) HIT family hydrolase
MNNLECPFCRDSGGNVLFEDERCRVVLVQGSEGDAYPGFCRVIWGRHVKEMSDLSRDDQHHILGLVMATESAVREVQQPDKMNVASLGNVTPHVHWHVIPRWQDDSHFPAPIWAAATRTAAARRPVSSVDLKRALAKVLREMKEWP